MNRKDAKDAKKGFSDRERKENHPAKMQRHLSRLSLQGSTL